MDYACYELQTASIRGCHTDEHAVPKTIFEAPEKRHQGLMFNAA
jgi:hypothetical protein